MTESGPVLKINSSYDKDRYAVGVFQNERIIGHLPRKHSMVCSLFLDRGGQISCTVIGNRRYSSDLVQGGMAVPCLVTFKSSKKSIKKLVKLL